MDDQITTIDQGVVAEAVREALKQWVSPPEPSGPPHELFRSPRAEALKEEIVRAGRKLWQREYVDGNGGNISARLSHKYVICTPTMLSKADLRVEDLSLVDLDNSQLIGHRPQTSEMLLHLEIYKEVPRAQAIIHCHPPYATAHAIAGVVPQGNLLPEQEVFIGPVVLAPYETPGTLEFARTVVPAVKQHNTILLTNHGIVCWADTVMHAEWCTEVMETYCKTVMIASQLRPTLSQIPAEKIGELLAIKKRLGLPDARLPHQQQWDRNERSAKPVLSGSTRAQFAANLIFQGGDVEALVSSITAEIMKVMGSRG